MTTRAPNSLRLRESDPSLVKRRSTSALSAVRPGPNGASRVGRMASSTSDAGADLLAQAAALLNDMSPGKVKAAYTRAARGSQAAASHDSTQGDGHLHTILSKLGGVAGGSFEDDLGPDVQAVDDGSVDSSSVDSAPLPAAPSAAASSPQRRAGPPAGVPNLALAERLARTRPQPLGSSAQHASAPMLVNQQPQRSAQAQRNPPEVTSSTPPTPPAARIVVSVVKSPAPTGRRTGPRGSPAAAAAAAAGLRSAHISAGSRLVRSSSTGSMSESVRGGGQSAGMPQPRPSGVALALAAMPQLRNSSSRGPSMSMVVGGSRHSEAAEPDTPAGAKLRSESESAPPDAQAYPVAAPPTERDEELRTALSAPPPPPPPPVPPPARAAAADSAAPASLSASFTTSPSPATEPLQPSSFIRRFSFSESVTAPTVADVPSAAAWEGSAGGGDHAGGCIECASSRALLDAARSEAASAKAAVARLNDEVRRQSAAVERAEARARASEAASTPGAGGPSASPAIGSGDSPAAQALQQQLQALQSELASLKEAHTAQLEAAARSHEEQLSMLVQKHHAELETLRGTEQDAHEGLQSEAHGTAALFESVAADKAAVEVRLAQAREELAAARAASIAANERALASEEELARVSTERDSLEATVGEAATAVSAAQEALSEAQSRSDELERELVGALAARAAAETQLRDQAAAHEAVAGDLRDRLRLVEDRTASREAELSTALDASRRETAAAVAAGQAERVAFLTLKLSQAQDAQDALKASLAQSEASAGALRAQLTRRDEEAQLAAAVQVEADRARDEEVASVVSQLTAVQGTVEEVLREKAAWARRTQEAQEDAQGAWGQVRAGLAAVAAISRELEAIESALGLPVAARADGPPAVSDALAQDTAALQSRIAGASHAVASLLARVEQLQTAATEAGTTASRLSYEAQGRDAIIARLRAQVAERDGDIAELQAQVAALRAQLARMQRAESASSAASATSNHAAPPAAAAVAAAAAAPARRRSLLLAPSNDVTAGSSARQATDGDVSRGQPARATAAQQPMPALSASLFATAAPGSGTGTGSFRSPSPRAALSFADTSPPSQPTTAAPAATVASDYAQLRHAKTDGDVLLDADDEEDRAAASVSSASLALSSPPPRALKPRAPHPASNVKMPLAPPLQAQPPAGGNKPGYYGAPYGGTAGAADVTDSGLSTASLGSPFGGLLSVSALSPLSHVASPAPAAAAALPNPPTAGPPPPPRLPPPSPPSAIKALKASAAAAARAYKPPGTALFAGPARGANASNHYAISPVGEEDEDEDDGDGGYRDAFDSAYRRDGGGRGALVQRGDSFWSGGPGASDDGNGPLGSASDYAGGASAKQSPAVSMFAQSGPFHHGGSGSTLRSQPALARNASVGSAFAPTERRTAGANGAGLGGTPPRLASGSRSAGSGLPGSGSPHLASRSGSTLYGSLGAPSPAMALLGAAGTSLSTPFYPAGGRRG